MVAICQARLAGARGSIAAPGNRPASSWGRPGLRRHTSAGGAGTRVAPGAIEGVGGVAHRLVVHRVPVPTELPGDNVGDELVDLLGGLGVVAQVPLGDVGRALLAEQV